MNRVGFSKGKAHGGVQKRGAPKKRDLKLPERLGVGGWGEPVRGKLRRKFKSEGKSITRNPYGQVNGRLFGQG